MPLTRHWYESDEVASALYYCSSRRDCKETEFWCHEMICSGYSSEAISVLFESWIWQRGPFFLSWLCTGLAEETVTEDMIIQSALQLSAYSEWDNSLFAVLCSTSVDRVTPRTPPFANGLDEKMLYLYRALYQGKARSAWGMIKCLLAEQRDVWTILREYGAHIDVRFQSCIVILERYEDLLGYRSDAYTMVILCLITLMLCLSDAKRNTSFAPCFKQERRSFVIGRKKSRLYAIPSVALYGTKRGSTLCTMNHFTGLYDVEKGIKGCPFWDEVLCEYQRHGKWVSDDAQTAFYDLYFPDDIPDEWSKEEKMKSHGAGLLHVGDRMTLHRYAKIHFTKPCRLAFMSTIPKLDGIEGCNVLDAIQYGPIEITLKPLRRRYVICLL